MIREVVMDLDDSVRRPIVTIPKMKNATALLDTGAYIPIWTDSERTLETQFGGKRIKDAVKFSGFGGETAGNLYLANMQIGELIFPEMPIVANSELKSSFDFIISSTMLDRLIYTIDMKYHKLTIAIPQGESNVRTLKYGMTEKDEVIVYCAEEQSLVRKLTKRRERKG